MSEKEMKKIKELDDAVIKILTATKDDDDDDFFTDLAFIVNDVESNE